MYIYIMLFLRHAITRIRRITQRIIEKTRRCTGPVFAQSAQGYSTVLQRTVFWKCCIHDEPKDPAKVNGDCAPI
jgi:hypothetical protein